MLEVIQIDNKDYVELLVEQMNNNTYVYLMNTVDKYDFKIRKIIKENNKLYYTNLDTEEEFDKVYNIFMNKMKENFESLGN